MTHQAAEALAAWLQPLDGPPSEQELDGVVATHVRDGLAQDARGLYYSALISFISAIDAAGQASFSWSIVKLYYTCFYAARSTLASNNVAIFYSGTKPYSCIALAGQRPRKEKGVTHKVVWSLFSREFPGNVLLNEIDGEVAYTWMTRLRETANYKNARFPDPLVPKAFSNLDTVGVSVAVPAYQADNSYIYTFDPDHAAVAFPIACVRQAKMALERNGIFLEQEEQDFVRQLSLRIGVSESLLL